MRDENGGCFSLVFGIIFIWLAWPVSWWLIVAGICTGLLQASLVKRQTEAAGGAIPGFSLNLLRQLRDSAGSITAGLAVVALAQLVLSLTNAFSETQVQAWENALALLKREFSVVMRLSVVIPCLSVLLLLTLCWPQFRLVKRFVAVKKWGGRVLLALTVITSFTFFSYSAVSSGEPKWIAQRKPRAEAAVDQIKTGSREMIALAWIERSVSNLPPPQRVQMRAFLEDTPHFDSYLGKEKIDALVDSATQIYTEHLPGESLDAFERVDSWINSSGPLPSLQDISAVSATADKVEQALPEARSAVEETIKTALGGVVPESLNLVVRAFVKALAGALVKTCFGRLDAHVVVAFDQAKATVLEKIPLRDGTMQRTMVELWVWRFPAPERGTSESSGSASHTYDTFHDPLGNTLRDPFLDPYRDTYRDPYHDFRLPEIYRPEPVYRPPVFRPRGIP